MNRTRRRCNARKGRTLAGSVYIKREKRICYLAKMYKMSQVLLRRWREIWLSKKILSGTKEVLGCGMSRIWARQASLTKRTQHDGRETEKFSLSRRRNKDEWTWPAVKTNWTGAGKEYLADVPFWNMRVCVVAPPVSLCALAVSGGWRHSHPHITIPRDGPIPWPHHVIARQAFLSLPFCPNLEQVPLILHHHHPPCFDSAMSSAPGGYITGSASTGFWFLFFRHRRACYVTIPSVHALYHSSPVVGTVPPRLVVPQIFWFGYGEVGIFLGFFEWHSCRCAEQSFPIW